MVKVYPVKYVSAKNKAKEERASKGVGNRYLGKKANAQEDIRRDSPKTILTILSCKKGLPCFLRFPGMVAD